MSQKLHKSHLKVQNGVEQPSQFSDSAVEKFKKLKQQLLPVEDYVKGIRKSDRTLLSKAITLVESALPEHHDKAQQIVDQCLPFSGNSIRIGITGVPGVGKSTFIEALGTHLTEQGHKLAVLAIDPSSQKTKGSILGDKTRMEELSIDKNAFIRPSPSAGTLGGVAKKTRESIILCEAAGFDVIFIETVGVGQSETAVHSMVDFFLLLMLAGAGDELQGIKRGIMEMADAIIINKADGDNLEKANLAKQQYKNALHLFPPSDSGWSTQVETCSSISKEGITETWSIVEDYVRLTRENGYFGQRRSQQLHQTMMETIRENLTVNFEKNEKVKILLDELIPQISQSRISPYAAAKKLLEVYFKYINR